LHKYLACSFADIHAEVVQGSMAMMQDAFGLEILAESDAAVAAWNLTLATSLEHRLIASDHVKAARRHEAGNRASVQR